MNKIGNDLSNLQIFQQSDAYIKTLNVGPGSNTVFDVSDHISDSFISEVKKQGKISIYSITSIDAALISDSENIAILNMASYKKPGGGILLGKLAQEEHLCMCSNLYQNINFDTYPLPPYSLIFSDNIRIIRRGNYLPLFKNKKVSVISAPALKLKGDRYSKMSLDLKEKYELIVSNQNSINEYHSKMIQAIFDISLMFDTDVLILGAWGCGVYGNDPVIMANLFKNVLEKVRYSFKEIIFAVYPDQESGDVNHTHFSNIVQSLNS